jgi:hypothetical protein
LRAGIPPFVSRGLRIALAAGGLLLVIQIVLLAIQLGVLRHSYSHIRAQDAKQSRLYPLQKENAHLAAPVLRDARRVIRPLGRQTGQLVKATDLLPALAAEGIPALQGARQLIGAILGRDLLGTLERTAEDVHASRGMLGQSLAIQRQSLETQRKALALQEQALAILRQSHAIQQETLNHARSIDNKTGGPLPTP